MSRTLQGGAIAFRSAKRSVLILLVRAKKAPDEWIFPKGHIESGETAEAAALRELQEEAGIIGESLGLIGSLDFQSGEEIVTVSYYLARYVSEVPAQEEREVKWCEPNEALSLLSHRDSAELLKSSFPVIETYVPRS